jgi:hypothetical protein
MNGLLVAIVVTSSYPLVTDIFLHFVSCTHNYNHSYQFVRGDYILLYNILSTYDGSGVYETTSVDATATSLNAIVQDAKE